MLRVANVIKDEIADAFKDIFLFTLSLKREKNINQVNKNRISFLNSFPSFNDMKILKNIKTVGKTIKKIEYIKNDL